MISLNYSAADKNKTEFRILTVDEQIFALNETAVSQNTKKATKFYLTVQYVKVFSQRFVMTKITQTTTVLRELKNKLF